MNPLHLSDGDYERAVRDSALRLVFGLAQRIERAVAAVQSERAA